jgi:hypothetical protein
MDMPRTGETARVVLRGERDFEIGAAAVVAGHAVLFFGKPLTKDV